MNTVKFYFKGMAKKYLESKDRTVYLQIRYYDDTYLTEECGYLHAFSNEELAKLRELCNKYGEKDFYNHLDEAFDQDTVDDIVMDEIVGFDLDTYNYMYRFTCHQITDNGVRAHRMMVNLTDEEYIQLLALHLEHKNMNLNKLRYTDKELYEAVVGAVDHNFDIHDLGDIDYPYAITMDEVIEDAQKIRGQNPEMFQDLPGF